MFAPVDLFLWEARRHRDGQQVFWLDEETLCFPCARLRSSSRAWAKALAMLVTVARLALIWIISLFEVVYGLANWLNISSMKVLYKILVG